MLHFHYGPLIDRLRRHTATTSQIEISNQSNISRSHIGTLFSPRFVPGSISFYPVLALCNYCNLYFPSLFTQDEQVLPTLVDGKCYFWKEGFQYALQERLHELKSDGQKIRYLSGLPRATVRDAANSGTINPTMRVLGGCLTLIGDDVSKFFPNAVNSPEAVKEQPVAEVIPEPIPVPVFVPVVDVVSSLKLQVDTQIPVSIKELQDYMLRRVKGFIHERPGIEFFVSVSGTSRYQRSVRESFLDYLVTVHDETDPIDAIKLLSFDNSAKNIAQAYHQFNADVEGHFFSAD